LGLLLLQLLLLLLLLLQVLLLLATGWAALLSRPNCHDLLLDSPTSLALHLHTHACRSNRSSRGRGSSLGRRIP
jgi:hypothetical protein